MKNLFLILLLLPFTVFADTYTLDVKWSDNTPASANYTPAYNVEYQIAALPVVAVSDFKLPSYTATITAAPGDIVKVHVQNKNTQGGIVSAWSAWMNASAQNAPTTPLMPSAITYTLTRVQ